MLINKAKLMNQILDGILNQIVDNYVDYVDEFGGITIDESNVFDHQFEKAFEDTEIPSWQKKLLYDEFWEHDDTDKAFGAAKDLLKDLIDDNKEWAKGPMSYYGLSNKDFL